MNAFKKSTLALCAMLVTGVAMALDPLSIVIYQADVSGGFYWGRILQPPAGDSFFMYDKTTDMPKYGAVGSGLNWDGSTLSFQQPSRTFAYLTRGLNTCFRPSATQDTSVNYAVDIATALSLTSGAQGTVYLRIYTNSGCTTGTQELVRFTNGQTGTLTIGLGLNQVVTARLSGIVPAGFYAQLVTENNVGTPTFTARPGQEVLI